MSRDGHPSAPDFATSPVDWLRWVERQIDAGTWPAGAATVLLGEWSGDHGNAWRIVQSVRGVEIRPALVAPFLPVSASPRISALGLGTDVEVEISYHGMCWVDRFPLDAFDLVGLGQAMLAERSLPHDNLRRLFPKVAGGPMAWAAEREQQAITEAPVR